MTTTDATSLSDFRYADVLDLRDLEELRDSLRERKVDEDQVDPLDEDEVELLHALDALFDDGDVGNPEDEPTMIAESYFEDYARELASDVGYLEGGDKNPLLNYIDWEAWARDVRMDYTSVEFAGQTFYLRMT